MSADRSRAPPTRATIALAPTYPIFAILLHSVGTVIVQATAMLEATKKEAAILEAFENLPIAITSFVVAAHQAFPPTCRR